MSKHWSEKLSVDAGQILLRWMRAGERFAQKETDAITKLLLEMNVKPGMKILDFCCGYGRHAVRLAEKGFKVTGVDLSEANINYSKKFAKERKASNSTSFLVGDARNIADILKHEEQFNGIIGILPAIGYYDEETDENVLEQLHQLTKLRGCLILDMTNRDYHMERFKTLKETVVGSPTYEVHHSYRFDYERSRRNESWKIHKVNKQNLKLVSTIDTDRRLYSLHELIDLYKRTGWTYIKSFGNYQLEPVNKDKPTILIMGKKELSL